MLAVSKAFPRADGFSKLSLLRPRFVYVWVRLPEIPVPLFLFAPLVMLEFFLMMGIWAIRRTQGPDPQLAFALHALGALRGQTWELRKMPPLALVEVETKPKALKPLYVKIGLW
ncbi:hypothetical protein [Meiothermus sp.]|uniref:hypothetical protein n=1 Tax=Meiothermus sp. TaxID=1955249 RepID=UPI00298F0EDE|nr:hypothetical protein [Meiothermus sp.]